MNQMVVIGAGIVGLATALRLRATLPGWRITIIEKESSPAAHQSSHNSGVLHCGLYYRPRSLKAKLAVAGIRQMIEFCRAHDIAHECCGKMVVAADTAEESRLKDLEKRGRANGLQGLRWMSPAQMKLREPHVAGVAALEVPEEGIVDYPAVCQAMVRLCEEKDVAIRLKQEVSKLSCRNQRWSIETADEAFEADFVVNTAGLHSDRVCRAAGSEPDCRIIPFRGEYYQLKPESQGLVRHLVYPVPDPHYPFLGVHFTRLIHGGIEAGPNAVLALSREAYRKTDFNLGDLFSTIAYRGFWRFLVSNWKMCFKELHQSLSRNEFCQSLKCLVPDITVDDLQAGGAGVRAQAMMPDGALADDFLMVERPGILHLLNAPSPAATASLAIAETVAARITARL